jgi:hypothetical protein
MPEDDLKRFRHQGKTSVEFADEMYIRLANHGAKQMPPMSADRVAEKFCMDGLDRAALKAAAERETSCKPN